MDESTILTAVPQSEWRRPVRRPDTSWMATLKNDLARHNLTLEEWRMLSNWLWISCCGDYWQQAELCTDGACRIMIDDDDIRGTSKTRTINRLANSIEAIHSHNTKSHLFTKNEAESKSSDTVSCKMQITNQSQPSLATGAFSANERILASAWAPSASDTCLW